ncbi:MAG: DUF805 domain-containing protein [Planctomycetia bacterium]|nr:DUF805 domain-containing protein [Planctomycetia bacterium]
MKIYIKLRDRAYGPLQEDAIQKMIASGKLKPQQEISFDGKAWFPARDCKELFANPNASKTFSASTTRGTPDQSNGRRQPQISPEKNPAEESFGSPFDLIENSDSPDLSGGNSAAGFAHSSSNDPMSAQQNMPSNSPFEESSGNPFANQESSQAVNPFTNQSNSPYTAPGISPAENNADQWFLSNDGKVGTGPYSASMIVQFIRENKARPHSLVWRKGTNASLLSDQAEFRSFFNGNPQAGSGFPGHQGNSFGSPSAKNSPSAINVFLKIIIQALTNQYLDFRGRSTRTQYWTFSIFCSLLFFLLFIPILVYVNLRTGKDPRSAYSLLFVLYSLIVICVSLAALIPCISIQARRLHDIGLSGWFTLLNLLPFLGNIALFIINVLPGTSGTNLYGPDPRIKNK